MSGTSTVPVKEINFTASPELSVRILALIKSDSAQRVLKNCHPHLITGFPGMPSEQALYHHACANGYNVVDRYVIYVGNDKTEVVEHDDMGVELPATVLDDMDIFNKEVLYRIRRVAGSVEDN